VRAADNPRLHQAFLRALLRGNPRDERFREVAQAAEPAVSQVANLRMPEWLRGIGIERNARVRRLRVAPTGSPRNRRQGCLRYKGRFAAGIVERDAALTVIRVGSN